MSSLAERQAAFAHALRVPEAPPPPDLATPRGAAQAERFAVYRNNVAVSLIEALRAGFPVVDRLVGQVFFGAMARIHALQSPPASPVLLAYGADFPAFIARFEPAVSIPYLADVARLEWNWLESYHAVDADPMPAAALGALPAQRWPNLRLVLHPAARLLRFDTPALSVWRIHQDENLPAAPDIEDKAEYALILRPHADVAVLDLSIGAFAFLSAIAAGESIADSLPGAIAAEPGLDVAALLPRLFVAGTFADFVTRDESRI